MVAGPVPINGDPLTLQRARSMLDRQDLFARNAPLPIAPAAPQAAAVSPIQRPQPSLAPPPAPAAPPATAPAPVPLAPAPATGPDDAGVLNKQEWAKQTHPEILKLPLLPRELHDNLQREYEGYVSTQMALASLGVRKGATAIAGRRAATAERNSNVFAAKEKRAAAAAPQIPPEVLQRGLAAIAAGKYEHKDARFLARAWKISDGSSKLSARDRLGLDAVAEVTKTGKRDGPAVKAFQLFTQPNKTGAGRERPIGNDALDKLFGDPLLQAAGMPSGILPKLKVDPVGGWLELYRYVQNRGTVGTADEQAKLAQLAAELMPTLEQVIAAEDAGTLTPEDKNEILQVIMSPEEQALLLRQGRTDAATSRNAELDAAQRDIAGGRGILGGPR